MASIIRIKRSSVAGNPATLAAGELAYSALPDNGSNGGDRLYIGTGTETEGNAANHVVIGGKVFTDAVNAATSNATPNTLVKRDASGDISVVDLTATGNVSITGDLTVLGTTTTVNSNTVDIADVNITLAKNATTSAQANGGGITVAGAAATMTYTSVDDRWNLNKALNVTAVYGNLVGSATTCDSIDGGTY